MMGIRDGVPHEGVLHRTPGLENPDFVPIKSDYMWFPSLVKHGIRTILW